MVKTSVLDKLGAQLQTLSKKDAADTLDVKGGVIVKVSSRERADGQIQDTGRIHYPLKSRRPGSQER